MIEPHFPYDRRAFLHLAFAFSATAILSGGGGGGSASDAAAVVSVPSASAAAPAAATSSPLNLALNLAYIGANYYAYAARGTGLVSTLTPGIGAPGVASGARQATFVDPLIAGYAAEIADDKRAHVSDLRTQIGLSAAAQPAIDLSTGSASAFSLAAQGAGIVAAGAAFDPYAGDREFLLGAFLIENAVAAAHRTLLAASDGTTTTTLIGTHLADAIYHGGLVRTLLADKASADPSIDRALANVSTLLATLDGTNVGDQTLAGASGPSSNIPDADGRPIPFTRGAAQVLRAICLSNGAVGGFLPLGANGVG